MVFNGVEQIFKESNDVHSFNKLFQEELSDTNIKKRKTFFKILFGFNKKN